MSKEAMTAMVPSKTTKVKFGDQSFSIGDEIVVMLKDYSKPLSWGQPVERKIHAIFSLSPETREPWSSGYSAVVCSEGSAWMETIDLIYACRKTLPESSLDVASMETLYRRFFERERENGGEDIAVHQVVTVEDARKVFPIVSRVVTVDATTTILASTHYDSCIIEFNVLIEGRQPRKNLEDLLQFWPLNGPPPPSLLPLLAHHEANLLKWERRTCLLHGTDEQMRAICHRLSEGHEGWWRAALAASGTNRAYFETYLCIEGGFPKVFLTPSPGR